MCVSDLKHLHGHIGTLLPTNCRLAVPFMSLVRKHTAHAMFLNLHVRSKCLCFMLVLALISQYNFNGGKWWGAIAHHHYIFNHFLTYLHMIHSKIRCRSDGQIHNSSLLSISIENICFPIKKWTRNANLKEKMHISFRNTPFLWQVLNDFPDHWGARIRNSYELCFVIKTRNLVHRYFNKIK